MPPSIHGICFDLFNALVNVGQVPCEVGGDTAEILGVGRERWRETCFGEQHEFRRNLHRMVHVWAIPETGFGRVMEHRQRRFDHALRLRS